MLLGSHVTLFIVVNAHLIGLNLLITPQNLWFPYALWGWSIAHALHIGSTSPVRDYLLGTALVTVTVSAGLVGLDAATSGATWAIWPVWAMLSVLAGHALYAYGKIGVFGAHLLVTVLGGIELLGAAIALPEDRFDFLFAIGYWLVGVAVHAMYRFGRPSLLQVHAVVFALTNALFIADSITDGDFLWSIYPLASWGVILAAHAVATVTAAHAGPPAWEPLMLSRLTQPGNPIRLVVIDRTTPGGPWWFWPVGVWVITSLIAIPLSVDLLSIVASDDSQREHSRDAS